MTNREAANVSEKSRGLHAEVVRELILVRRNVKRAKREGGTAMRATVGGG